jgi:hypothetical protein
MIPHLIDQFKYNKINLNSKNEEDYIFHGIICFCVDQYRAANQSLPLKCKTPFVVINQSLSSKGSE